METVPDQGREWDGAAMDKLGMGNLMLALGRGAVGCSPPSCSLGCGEAQEELCREAGACCAPAVPCFPSYTAQLAGCLHRPELILAAPRFPLLPSLPAFPLPGTRLPRTHHPQPLPATLGGGGSRDMGDTKRPYSS